MPEDVGAVSIAALMERADNIKEFNPGAYERIYGDIDAAIAANKAKIAKVETKAKNSAKPKVHQKPHKTEHKDAIKEVVETKSEQKNDSVEVLEGSNLEDSKKSQNADKKNPGKLKKEPGFNLVSIFSLSVIGILLLF